MTARFGPFLAYALFAIALVAATTPAWRPWIFGATFTLEDLLALRCF